VLSVFYFNSKHIKQLCLDALMMEAARTSETSVDNYFTRQYIPEDKSELHTVYHFPAFDNMNVPDVQSRDVER
jgi:hypothetical protein